MELDYCTFSQPVFLKSMEMVTEPGEKGGWTGFTNQSVKEVQRMKATTEKKKGLKGREVDIETRGVPSAEVIGQAPTASPLGSC